MTTPPILQRRWVRLTLAVALFALVTMAWPRWWCGREGARLYDGDAALTLALARNVAATVSRDVSAAEFTSSTELFRHEWLFGTYQMAALGLLQVCREHPELRNALLPAAERAIDKLLSPEIRRFDAKAWGEDPLESLDGMNGHAAYLGYLNLVLSVHRRWVPGSKYRDLNDRITAALLRRFQSSPIGILETYPGEAYPVDNAAGFASILLCGVQSDAERACIARVLENYRSRWRDPRNGLLYQSIDFQNGRPLDGARASGSALAAYFLSFGEREVSRGLHDALVTNAFGSVLGFGFMFEHPGGASRKTGDIDSGPLILGISPSGTGFSLGSCRIFRERPLFVSLARTAYVVGTPISRDEKRLFVMGGPLGNSILLAMFTAQPAGR